MATTAVKTSLTISSPAFAHEGYIPSDYTCEGSGKNPPLEIKGIPQEAKSLALIMEDPDAPGKIFDHWVVWNIPPDENIAEDTTPGTLGRNSAGTNNYTPPCPPSGTHRYFFKIYALDAILQVQKGADKITVEKALQSHVIAYGELIGLYKKQKR
jgi:Raf kinase inhibitor-like YbhB/YbcL family protein